MVHVQVFVFFGIRIWIQSHGQRYQHVKEIAIKRKCYLNIENIYRNYPYMFLYRIIININKIWIDI